MQGRKGSGDTGVKGLDDHRGVFEDFPGAFGEHGEEEAEGEGDFAGAAGEDLPDANEDTHRRVHRCVADRNVRPTGCEAKSGRSARPTEEVGSAHPTKRTGRSTSRESKLKPAAQFKRPSRRPSPGRTGRGRRGSERKRKSRSKSRKRGGEKTRSGERTVRRAAPYGDCEECPSTARSGGGLLVVVGGGEV